MQCSGCVDPLVSFRSGIHSFSVCPDWHTSNVSLIDAGFNLYISRVTHKSHVETVCRGMVQKKRHENRPKVPHQPISRNARGKF